MTNENPYLVNDNGLAYMSNTSVKEVIKTKPNF